MKSLHETYSGLPDSVLGHLAAAIQSVWGGVVPTDRVSLVTYVINGTLVAALDNKSAAVTTRLVTMANEAVECAAMAMHAIHRPSVVLVLRGTPFLQESPVDSELLAQRVACIAEAQGLLYNADEDGFEGPCVELATVSLRNAGAATRLVADVIASPLSADEVEGTLASMTAHRRGAAVCALRTIVLASGCSIDSANVPFTILEIMK